MNGKVLGAEGVLDFPLHGVSLIEASAGTGKTYTIANLHLLHVLAGRMVGDVLVVTFTNAATDELRGRIRARLFEALAALQRDAPGGDAFLAAWCARIGTSDERDLAVRRLRLALRSMDTAPIYTIHSFCQHALSEFAFNSGQQFQMELLTDDRELWRQAVQDWWRKTAYPLSGIRLRWFTDATGGLASFRTLLAPLLAAQRKTLLPKVDSLEQEWSALDAMGPELKSIAARWLAKGERDRLEEILLHSPRLSRNKKRPYHADKLTPALLKLDQYFHAVDAQPIPKEFELLTPRCMQAFATKKDDPALADDFFARCGALWESLQRERRRLRVAALASAADFAGKRCARPSAKRNYCPTMICSTRCTRPCTRTTPKRWRAQYASGFRWP